MSNSKTELYELQQGRYSVYKGYRMKTVIWRIAFVLPGEASSKVRSHSDLQFSHPTCEQLRRPTLIFFETTDLQIQVGWDLGLSRYQLAFQITAFHLISLMFDASCFFPFRFALPLQNVVLSIYHIIVLPELIIKRTLRIAWIKRPEICHSAMIFMLVIILWK